MEFAQTTVLRRLAGETSTISTTHATAGGTSSVVRSGLLLSWREAVESSSEGTSVCVWGGHILTLDSS